MSRKHRWKLDGVERQGLFKKKKERKKSQMTEIKAFKSAVRVLYRLQGKLGNLEPPQDDVSAPAVLRPAGQRGGTAASPHPIRIPGPSRLP